MVSDVLSDAVDGIKYYLGEPAFNDVYSGNLRKRLERLLHEMNVMRVELDTPPPDKE